jgi:hypothetical protein
MLSRATAPGDDGDDLVAAEGGEFDFRIHCAIGEGCDLAATLRGCYAAWASAKGERGRGLAIHECSGTAHGKRDSAFLTRELSEIPRVKSLHRLPLRSMHALQRLCHAS